MSLLLDGLSFQSPTKGLSAAAPNAQFPKPVEIAAKAVAKKVRKVNFTLGTPLSLPGPSMHATSTRGDAETQFIGWYVRSINRLGVRGQPLGAGAFPRRCAWNAVRMIRVSAHEKLGEARQPPSGRK